MLGPAHAVDENSGAMNGTTRCAQPLQVKSFSSGVFSFRFGDVDFKAIGRQGIAFQSYGRYQMLAIFLFI